MAEITMPQLGETVTEGTITRWAKQVGDSVKEDESSAGAARAAAGSGGRARGIADARLRGVAFGACSGRRSCSGGDCSGTRGLG
jgi:hypothetical protein